MSLQSQLTINKPKEENVIFRDLEPGAFFTIPNVDSMLFMKLHGVEGTDRGYNAVKLTALQDQMKWFEGDAKVILYEQVTINLQ